MANTYACLKYHLIFSTKSREPWLKPEIEERIWAYLGGIARQNHMTPLQMGGTDDHIHILFGAPPSCRQAKSPSYSKGGSSTWVHATFPDMHSFAWQDGYGAFTVSKSNVPEVSAYIKKQREHHRTITFQEEYLAFLRRHDIEFDERYVWR